MGAPEFFEISVFGAINKGKKLNNIFNTRLNSRIRAMISNVFFSLIVIALLTIFDGRICVPRSHQYADLFLNEINGDGSGEELDDTLVETTENSINSSPSSCPRSTRRNTDDFIDKVLKEVRPKLPEPAFLPERNGRFRLFNGTLGNLATLQRTGPALVRCTDSTFSFLVPIGLTNLTGKYFWELDSGLPVFRGLVNMFIGKAEADVLYTRERSDVYGSSEKLPQKAMVEQLKITRLEGVRVKFDGIGPFSRILSRFTNMVAKYFSRGVSKVLEGPVKIAINKELKNIEKYEKYFF